MPLVVLTVPVNFKKDLLLSLFSCENIIMGMSSVQNNMIVFRMSI